MKILNLQKYLREKKISFALFFNFEDKENPNYYYLSSYEGYGALLVPQDGKATLFTAEMEWEKASKTVKEKNICVKRYKKKLLPMLKEIIKGKKKLGVDKSQITVEFYYRLKKFFKGKKLMDIAEPCRQLRAVKNDREIEYLRKACSISDSIISRCIGNFKKFKTEMDVSNFLGDETIRRGCKLAFPAIVASGSGSSQPHYVPRKIRLKKGFCVIDFGVVYHGYRSDTTRTVYLGKPSLKETDMYDLLLNTQLETAKHVKENIICSKLYDKCVSELGRYSKYFIHGLGHGVGVEIHEMPNLRQDSKEKIRDGMVFTIEPGVYFTGKYGIRIEDTVMWCDGRLEILTKYPKKLIVIKR